MNSDNIRQQLRIRRNIVDLQDAYEQGDKAPLENLMRAWQGMQAPAGRELRALTRQTRRVLGAGSAVMSAGWS